ncbi:glycine betaine ABC transporter substrate-binding protein [Arthrobacter sp. GMC3]|uniref:glycine betaine ABC transporter substrate-binding protein n=1 Tax=Arthrobacter sp. GMC3 TaxID=2058894 RepID=UPI000CE351F0|nr:glycine betaine ABC transporter substrate-binding protein [Arthrobacter sp. GMC3]
MRLQRIAAGLGVALVLASGVTACTPTPIVAIPSVSQIAGGTPIKVGTPAVPDGAVPLEGALLANVYAAALNAAGVMAVVSPEDPKDPTLLGQLENGAVDIVPSYSSTVLDALASANPQPSASPSTSAASSAVNNAVSSSQVLNALESALPPSVSMANATSAEDDDNLVVTTVTAEKYQLKTIADLAKVCDKLVFGGSAEFRTKVRGLPTLATDYNCIPQRYVELPNTYSELLLALLRADVQVADIHSSSPAISDNDLVVLTDNRQIFRPQTVVPLVSSKHVSEDVTNVLNKVSAVLNSDELINLNRLSSESQFGSLSEVATAWLVEVGLIKATS